MTLPRSNVNEREREGLLSNFKTQPCQQQGTHDHRCCPFYHSLRDRRRNCTNLEGGNLSGDTYTYCAEPCKQQFDERTNCCPRSDACGRCHSSSELLYHPDLFRKRLCHCHQAKKCPRGQFCAFAHNREELLVPHFTEVEEYYPSEDFMMNKFKTEWCILGGPHDWDRCVYAHTYRDYRRNPLLGYSSRPCDAFKKSVETGAHDIPYQERCPCGMACPSAHGAKEQLYHKDFYKTSGCTDGARCQRGPLCAFHHGPQDTRIASNATPKRQPMQPLNQAYDLLEGYQQTYKNPPRYHALEEPARGGFAFSRAAPEFCIPCGSVWDDVEHDDFKGSTGSTPCPSPKGRSKGKMNRLEDSPKGSPKGSSYSESSSKGSPKRRQRRGGGGSRQAHGDELMKGMGKGKKGDAFAMHLQYMQDGSAERPDSHFAPYLAMHSPDMQQRSAQLIPPSMGYSEAPQQYGHPFQNADFCSAYSYAAMNSPMNSPMNSMMWGPLGTAMAPMGMFAQGHALHPMSPPLATEADIRHVTSRSHSNSDEDATAIMKIPLAMPNNLNAKYDGLRTPSWNGTPQISAAQTEAPHTPRTDPTATEMEGTDARSYGSGSSDVAPR